jgi:hypothetical protein
MMHDSENKNMDSAVKIIITFACMVIKKKDRNGCI